jgi:hypothetical protein
LRRVTDCFKGYPAAEYINKSCVWRLGFIKKTALCAALRNLFDDDTVGRTVDFTNTAVDALFRVDHVDITGGNAVDRATFFTSAAGDTSIQNFSWHNHPSLNLCVRYYFNKQTLLCKDFIG